MIPTIIQKDHFVTKIWATYVNTQKIGRNFPPITDGSKYHQQNYFSAYSHHLYADIIVLFKISQDLNLHCTSNVWEKDYNNRCVGSTPHHGEGSFNKADQRWGVDTLP